MQEKRNVWCIYTLPSLSPRDRLENQMKAIPTERYKKEQNHIFLNIDYTIDLVTLLLYSVG